MNQFGCPYAKDPKALDAGTGNPADGSFFNLATSGAIEKRFGGGNIRDEKTSRDSNTPGSLSMANTGVPSHVMPFPYYSRPPPSLLATARRGTPWSALERAPPRGSLSELHPPGLARAGRPHSGGSQFFMNVNHNVNLDWFSKGAFPAGRFLRLSNQRMRSAALSINCHRCVGASGLRPDHRGLRARRENLQGV